MYRLRCRFSLLQGSSLFAIDALGAITYAATATVDYETTTSYTIAVLGTVQQGEITVSDDLTIVVEVVDVLERIIISDTDNALNSIVENTSSGTVVAGITLQAVDEGNDNVSSAVEWGLLQGSTAFSIDAIGTIRYVSASLTDYEMTPSYTIVVSGTVSRGTATVSDHLTLTIAVINVLEHIALSDANRAANTLVENAASGTMVSGIGLQVIDEGGGRCIVCGGVESIARR